jgi:hypothetical protein
MQQTIAVQPGLYVTATGTTSYTYAHVTGSMDLWLLLLCMRTYSTCAKAKLESQRTAGSKTPGGGAQRPRADSALNCCCATVRPKRHQGHRWARRGIKRNTKGTGGHTGDQETPRGPEGTTGRIERDTKRTGWEQRGPERAVKPKRT